MPKRAGRPSVAQTPAPKSDKIYGSKKNPKGSATEKKSKSITLSNKTIDTLKEKLDKFKKSHPAKKSITLGDLKAVYRRGSGAYSNSHRPTITGGAPNSRAAWSYARVNKFLKKAGGAKVKAAYVQDDDLMADGGKVFNDKELLAKWKKGESIGFTGEAHLKAKGLIPRANGTKKKSAKYMADGGISSTSQVFILEQGAKVPKGGDCYEAAAQFCMGFMPEPVEFVGEPYLVHAEVKGQGKAEGIRFGHAWVEDDENVYDYSSGRRIVMPKVVYYAIGDIQTENPEKYQRYTFPEARAKMLKTKHYGSWDIDTEYADGAEIVAIDEPVEEKSQLVTCINCGWEWETADSAEYDKYVCHQCGFDNSLFYDGGLLKPTMPLNQIAEKHGVSIEYLEEQLQKGMEHEKEHTDSDEVATSIALHHLAERPDYYEELEKMKLEDGGEVTISDEDYEFWIGGDENVGKAIELNGLVVGGIAYEDEEIKGIVIKNKFRRKGLAKRAIKALFDKNPDLDKVYVRAVPESKGFWKRIGTDFDNYNEDAGLWEGYVKRFENGDVILEDNSPEEYEIEDFLKQQKEEAHMVMTCDSSKIYKAMICKTKCEIADKRMSETENAEELNAWLHYKNTWNDCLQDILDNNIEMYKAGGKTCGCGCGSIYSKGGVAYSKGGLAYGNSHDKGGMPLKVKSTGQNIEIEGGEGVINKRSMQSSKKVEFQGKQMTPCEAVSKINEMGGGVKFKCADVKNILEEDGQF